MNEREELKQIDAPFDAYYVSNLGNVYSKKSGSLIKLKARSNKKGYLLVNLVNRKISKNFRVHRLVATYFIGYPREDMQVNHLDHNKQNNNLTNLEWVGGQANIEYAMTNGKIIPSSIINEYLSLREKVYSPPSV